jgi:hypothetical protein
MDNYYRPPGGEPGDHQPTEQFWPGHGAPASSHDPGHGPHGEPPGRQAPMAKDRRKALRWTAGIALAAVLAAGGVITGASLASPTLSGTPTAGTGTAGTGTAGRGTASSGGGTGSDGTGAAGLGSAAAPAGQASQAALLNSALNAAGSPNAAVTTTASAAGAAVSAANPPAAAGPAGAGPAAGPCARAVRAARLARLAGHPVAARRAASAAVRCRLVRRRIIRFFLLRGVDGQFTFRTRTGTIRTLAYERGVVESVNSGSSIVVKAADGTTGTWTLVSNTVVREQGGVVSESALTTGEQVWVGGPVVSGTKDARLIFVNPPGGSS